MSASATVINATSINWSINQNFIPVFSTQNSFATTQTDSLKTYYNKYEEKFEKLKKEKLDELLK